MEGKSLVLRSISHQLYSGDDYHHEEIRQLYKMDNEELDNYEEFKKEEKGEENGGVDTKTNPIPTTIHGYTLRW